MEARRDGLGAFALVAGEGLVRRRFGCGSRLALRLCRGDVAFDPRQLGGGFRLVRADIKHWPRAPGGPLEVLLDVVRVEHEYPLLESLGIGRAPERRPVVQRHLERAAPWELRVRFAQFKAREQPRQRALSRTVEPVDQVVAPEVQRRRLHAARGVDPHALQRLDVREYPHWRSSFPAAIIVNLEATLRSIAPEIGAKARLRRRPV